MAVDPAALPNAGSEWRTTRYNDDDYRPNDCLWNAAWNQLRAEGAGGPPPRGAEVQTRVDKLVQDYGIRNPDVVTKAQLDRIAQDNYGKSSQQGYGKMVRNANEQPDKGNADGMRGRISDGYITQLANKPGADKQSATGLNANFVTIMTNHTDKDWNTDWTAVGKDIATLAKSNPALATEMSNRAFTLMGRPTSLLRPPLIKETFSDPGQVHAQIATGMAQNLNGDQLKALSPEVLKQMDAALPAGADKTKVEQALGLTPPTVAGSSYTPNAQSGSAPATKIAVYGTPGGTGPGSGVYYTTNDALSIGGICVKDPFNTPGYVPLDPNNRHSSLARPASPQEYANFKSLYPS